jgi:hypothetical protein
VFGGGLGRKAEVQNPNRVSAKCAILISTKLLFPTINNSTKKIDKIRPIAFWVFPSEMSSKALAQKRFTKKKRVEKGKAFTKNRQKPNADLFLIYFIHTHTGSYSRPCSGAS